MPRATITAYAIFKNEAPRVERWVDTTADCDARFVLDTGSTDDTVDELERLGVEHEVAEFRPFRFDDARNCALALCPDTDLVLRLDADEVLDPTWRDALDAVWHPEVARFRYTVRNHGERIIWGEHTRDDLHARYGFRWRYPTHEVLEGVGSIREVPGMVVHHHAEDKDRSFNIPVLSRAVRDDPHDRRMAFYYARELWYSGQWDDCRTEMTRFLALPDGWGAERCEAYRILAAIDHYPERWLWKAVGECPERREPWVDLARIFAQQARWLEAEAMLDIAEQRNDPTVYTTDPRAWGPEYDEFAHSIRTETHTPI